MTLGGPLMAKALGWTATAAIVSFVGMTLFTLAFFTTRERVRPSERPLPVRRALGHLARNRPLHWLLLSMVVGFGSVIFQVGGAVLAVVVFGDVAAGLFLAGLTWASPWSARPR